MRRGRRIERPAHAFAIVATACAAAVLLAALALTARDSSADKKPKRSELIWTHPDFSKFNLQSITLLPAVGFENKLEDEKRVDVAVGAALRPTGYRWVSGTTAREMLRRDSPGDSLLKAVREQILTNARVDSIDAPRLCARFRTRAVLSVRVERWEQVQIEWDQAGKPATTVSLHAALVDSLGSLLWSASGTEFAEGAYHEAKPNVIGVKSSGLGTQPVGDESAVPSFESVLAPLMARWASQFPPKPVRADSTHRAAP
jgi:hypothetical protein